MVPAQARPRARAPLMNAPTATRLASLSWAAAVFLLLPQLLPVAHASAAGIDETGYLPPHTIERLFCKTISADSARKNLKKLTSRPHQAGSIGDFELAKVCVCVHVHVCLSVCGSIGVLVRRGFGIKC
jgi:hypothetical protein